MALTAASRKARAPSRSAQEKTRLHDLVASLARVTTTRPPRPRIRIEEATPEDIPGIVAVRVNAAEDLTARFGGGHWSGHATEKGVAWDMRQGKVLVARRGERRAIVATLKIATRKPWAIDVSWFAPCKKPWYLTNMAVDPAHQGMGIGKRSVLEAVRLVRTLGGDAVRLDAYDSVEGAGAGPFYEKCGFTEVGRATYRVTPLIYYELRLIDSA